MHMLVIILHVLHKLDVYIVGNLHMYYTHVLLVYELYV